MTPARLAELEALHAAAMRADWGSTTATDALTSILESLPALLVLAREALARREGATAYQALCSRLWRDGWSTTTVYDGAFVAWLRNDQGAWHISPRHDTEVAAVEAAVAKRERNDG